MRKATNNKIRRVCTLEMFYRSGMSPTVQVDGIELCAKRVKQVLGINPKDLPDWYEFDNKPAELIVERRGDWYRVRPAKK